MIIFFIALFILIIANRKVNIICWLTILYYVTTYSYSYLVIKSSPSIWEPIIVIALSVIVWFGWENMKDSFLNGFGLYFELMLYLQVILQILFPNGLFVNEGYAQNWILGFKNLPIRFLMPGACIVLLRAMYAEKRNKMIPLRVLTYLLAFGYVIFTSQSATAIIGIIVFYVCLWFLYTRPMPTWFNIKNSVIVSAIVFILIFFLDFQYNFEFLITNILGKSLDFTGRIYVWEKAVNLLKDSWLFGTGHLDSINRLLAPYNHAHQYWLHIFMTTGICGGGIVYLIYWLTSVKVQKSTDNVVVKIITSAVVAFMVMGINEALAKSYMLLPLLVMAYDYNTKSLIKIKFNTG